MVFGCDCCCISSFVYLVGALTIASKVLPFLKKKLLGNKPIELQEKNYKKDVVYLYQLPGTPTSSSFSPYCVKVEAFLRLHNIQFERRNTMSARGSNGLLPFIELNGEQHTDSQIIIKRLTQIFKLKAYPDEQSAAIGHAVDRMIENHTANVMMHTRLPILPQLISFIAAPKVPAFLLPILSSLAGCFASCKKGAQIVGAIGKFSDVEYREMLKNDLVQLQVILGKKKFLVAEEPTAVDCTVMGLFGSAYFAIPSVKFYLNDLFDTTEFDVLKEYLERNKERLFGKEFRDPL